MAELRPHYIDVDLKKNTQYNVPVVTQNDTATHFIIRVTDDGLTDPELLDAYQEITMTSQRPDGESFYLTGTRIPGTNEIEFHLGTDETAFYGSILASLQFYLVGDASRYTSAQFRYDVKKDLTTNYTPTQREETLVEVVLKEGPGVIQEAKDAKVAVDGALVDLEQDKTAAIGRLDEVTEENKTVFRQPVNTFADLATTYPNPEHGTTVRVTGESATYRYSDGSWVKTDEYNPTAIDQVTAQLAETVTQADVAIAINPKADKTYVDTELTKKMNAGSSVNISQIDKNSGKLDQTYLSDELLLQITGNAPVNATPPNLGTTTLKLANDAVTPEKVSYIKRSSNLFNPATETLGHVIGADGTITANSGYNYTEFISTKPSTVYSFFGFIHVLYYGENKNLLNRASITEGGGTFTTPANCYYVRFNHRTATAYKNAQLNEGALLLAYESWYTPYLKNVNASTLNDKSVSTKHLENQSVTAEILEDEVVSRKKTNFIKSSTNIFNKNTAYKGYSISSTDGNLVVNDSYDSSDYIRVLPSTGYSFYGFIAVAYYDKNKTFIQRVTLSYTGQTITTPSTAYYVRAHNEIGSAYRTERRINEGSLVLPFEDFYSEFEVGSGLEELNSIIKNQTIDIKDSYMMDIPIDQVFDTSETYDAYTDFRNVTSAQVYQLYDDLMALYPEYITKQVLGNDAWGHPISLYKFTPIKPSATVETKFPKIFLTSGTHGYEHVPGLITYLMFEDICKRWQNNSLLEALRFNVDFLVIPVVNPSGWNDYTRSNRNGVDIARNFPEGWILEEPSSSTYGGTAPLTELESQYVKSVFDNNPDIDIMYDFHNFAGSETTNFFMWLTTGAVPYVQHMSQTLFSRMTRKWRKEYSFMPADNDWFAGYSDHKTGGMIHDHATGRGIKFTGTFEVGGRWWIEPAESVNDLIYNTTHKVTGVEALVNWLLINLKELIK